jgi:hypothetical protein
MHPTTLTGVCARWIHKPRSWLIRNDPHPPLALEPYTKDGARWWRVINPVSIELGMGAVAHISEGFETDLASVPRLLWAVIPPWTPGLLSRAVLHDWLYSTKPVSRQRADAIFREAMADHGLPSWKRWPIWFAVQMFGGSHYDPAKAGK